MLKLLQELVLLLLQLLGAQVHPLLFFDLGLLLELLIGIDVCWKRSDIWAETRGSEAGELRIGPEGRVHLGLLPVVLRR